MRALLAQVGRWSPSQRALRAVVLLGPVLALLVAGPAGHAAPSWLLLVVVVGSAAFAVAPEGWWGTAVLVVVLGWWCQVPDAGLDPLVLVAALGVVAAHVAALLAAYGPGEAQVDPALTVRWVARGGLALLVTGGVWLVAVEVRGEDAPGGTWTAGLVVAVLALVGGSVAVRRTAARP